MKPSSPCHYCERRALACHIDCKEYIEYCTELAKINDLINKAKGNETRFIQSKQRVKRSR